MRTKGVVRPCKSYRRDHFLSCQQPRDGSVLTVECFDSAAVLPVQELLDEQQQQQGDKHYSGSKSSSSSSMVHIQWLPDGFGKLHQYTLAPDTFIASDDDDNDSSSQQLLPAASSSILLQLQQHFLQLQVRQQQQQQQGQLACSSKQQDDDQHADRQQALDQQKKPQQPLQQQSKAPPGHLPTTSPLVAAGDAAAGSHAGTAAAAAAAAAAWADVLAKSCCCEHCGAAHSMSWARTGAPGYTKLTCDCCTQHYQQTGKHRKLPGGLLAGMPGVLLRPPASVLSAAAAAAAAGDLAATEETEDGAAAAATAAGVQEDDTQELRICSNCASCLTPYSWTLMHATSTHSADVKPAAAVQQQHQVVLCDACAQYQGLVGKARPIAAADRAAAAAVLQQLLAAQRGVLQEQQRQQQQWLQQLERRRRQQRERTQRYREKAKQHKKQGYSQQQQQQHADALQASADPKRQRSEGGQQQRKKAKQATAAAAAASQKQLPKAPGADTADDAAAAAAAEVLADLASGGAAAAAAPLSRASSTTSSSGSSGEAGKPAGGRSKPCSGCGPKPPGFKRLKRNLYVCRPRAAADADDVHVCSCDPSQGQFCREADGCLNRLLKVCCEPRSCPAGEACQNGSLAKRQLPPLRVVPMGAKGWGVVAQQDLPAGALVAEYLGEVVTVAEGKRRLAAYAASGLAHTYLMDLSKAEVIDATVKGGTARFINHSCEPNCETQKWQDGGELVVAIVATAAIPAGTELTYDYRYQSHVLPHARTRCRCGAAACRGWLGSLDPQAHLTAQLQAAEQEAERRVRRQVDSRTGEEVEVDDLDPMHSEDEGA